MGLLFFYISFAQNEKSTSTQKMSNYEKYVLAKEKAAEQDTIYKDDTVFVEREWDDLYYTPSKDELKRKAKDLRLRKKEIKIEQDSLYYDAKEEVYDDISFTAQIYRFHRPYYGFGYYSYCWDPFYDPWFLDPWHYGYSPYYGFSYPYYHSYWGFGFGYPEWSYPYYSNVHNHYGNNYYRNSHHGYNHNSIIQYGRRERPSNLTSNYRRQPVTVNRTIQVDRSTGRTSMVQKNRRTTTTSGINNHLQRINSSSERRVSTNYTPSYTQPRMSKRPQYNNTNPNKSYTTPAEGRTISQSQSSTQNRSYSAPRTSTNRSSTYSATSRNYNSGSSSSRNHNSGSSFSGGSRSSGSSSEGSSGFGSGGSSSRSGSSGSSSGRR